MEAGDLDDLRAAVPERYVDIRYRGAPLDCSALPGAVVQSEPGQVRLRMTAGTSLGEMLAALPPTQEVTSFAYRPPTLSELFRRAVAA